MKRRVSGGGYESCEFMANNVSIVGEFFDAMKSSGPFSPKLSPLT